MLPVVRGEDETRRQILLYTVLLYAVTQLPFCAGGFGVAYLVASMLLGGGFIYLAVRLLRTPDRAGRCAPTSSRSPTWRCCSVAMAARPGAGVCVLIEFRRGPRDRTSHIAAPACSPAASPRRSSPSPSSSRSSTSRS